MRVFPESEREVDFITGNISNPLPLETKYISSSDWKNRRFSGIKLFIKRFSNVRKVLIISKNLEKEMKINTTSISIIPLWKFLLSSVSYI